MAGKQKTADLSAGLLAVKGSAVPAQALKPRAADPAPAPAVEQPKPAREADEGDRNDAPLNFRVSPAFRREFKTYAAQNDLKLNELLRRAFDAYKGQESR